MTIRRPHDALGSGAVGYRADRPILHFATPPAEIQARIQADRLRASGFLLASKEEQ